MQKITPCLWYDGQALEAAEHYVTIFGGDSRILGTTSYGESGPGETGSVLTVDFRLAGQDYMGLNGGPQFPFTEAISLSVDCADQAEVDRFWDALSEGGETGQCGWLKDRYGVSWQIVPNELPRLLADPDPAKADRTMKAMLAMTKLDIQALRDA
ncbi:VOC family protein [Streptomyces sp. V2I9]|uniref:VOC family protein n=1 Tax=unclassified Streptomyces TaxID=2593676 RepID=UPI00278A0715|nr:VOC family protein [Streptomyces sp. V2I9]MDQ0986427.1 putative 3-demethylubiquinone-9 3-methyltransferase (glyoxalase superfamily) [Streptomyces sp. V2I9]